MIFPPSHLLFGLGEGLFVFFYLGPLSMSRVCSTFRDCVVLFCMLVRCCMLGCWLHWWLYYPPHLVFCFEVAVLLFDF